MPKTIFYFVDDIDLPFVMKDIRMVAAHFDTVVLFSTEKLDGKEHLPKNVKVIEEFMDWKRYKKMQILLSNIFGIFGIYIRESIAAGKVLPFKTSLALIGSNIFKAEEVIRHRKNLDAETAACTLYYSFWFYDCIYLAWLKSKNNNLKVITRAHSGDLYEDHISISDKLLFRNFQLKHLFAVYPVSNMGTEYLAKKYPKYASKCKTIFLGTDDKGVLNPFDSNAFVIVSCASLRHHKRIHRIAEALLHVNIPITWYHFGNENLHTNDPKIPNYIYMKNALLAKQNVKYIPMGYTENEKLYEFYMHNPVNLFVSLSAAEGIPVSIMEAISFGIPVLSTDVGGCREIVNDNTGMLIPLKTTVTEVAGILEQIHTSKLNTLEFRSGVRKYWKEHFEASANYKTLFTEIN